MFLLMQLVILQIKKQFKGDRPNVLPEGRQPFSCGYIRGTALPHESHCFYEKKNPIRKLYTLFNKDIFIYPL